MKQDDAPIIRFLRSHYIPVLRGLTTAFGVHVITDRSNLRHGPAIQQDNDKLDELEKSVSPQKRPITTSQSPSEFVLVVSRNIFILSVAPSVVAECNGAANIDSEPQSREGGQSCGSH